MRFYKVWPFMAGFPSEKTIGDLNSRGPELEYLEFILDAQPDSDIIGQDNIVLASSKLVQALKRIDPTGVQFVKDNVTLVGDANFQDGALHADYDEWWWLKLLGKPGQDDLAYDAGLIVSDKAMSIIKTFSLEFCTVQDYYADALDC